MADKTIGIESVVLINNFPVGNIMQFNSGAPLGGFTGSDHHNVAVAKFGVGTMAQVWNDGTVSDGVPGWSTLMYGQNVTTAIADAHEMCQPASATSIYSLSSTKANAIMVNDISMMGAVSISAMTIAYYGWFWVGGVCPSSWVAALSTGDLPTNNAVIIGQACIGPATGTKNVLQPQAAGELDSPCAFCLTVDAT